MTTKYFYTLLFISLFAVLGFSQNVEKTSKFAFGLSFEPDLCYRQLNFKDVNATITDTRNDTESAMFGFSTGINFRYNRNEKWALDAAILFVNNGFQKNATDFNWVSAVENLPQRSNTTFIHRNIIIPVKANYNFKMGKMNAYFTAGTSFNVFVNRKTSTTNYYETVAAETSTRTYRDGLTGLTMSLIGGLGINCPLSKRLLLNLEPNFRQGITSVYNDKRTQEYLYTVGLSTKLYYNF